MLYICSCRGTWQIHIRSWTNIGPSKKPCGCLLFLEMTDASWASEWKCNKWWARYKTWCVANFLWEGLFEEEKCSRWDEQRKRRERGWIIMQGMNLTVTRASGTTPLCQLHFMCSTCFFVSFPQIMTTCTWIKRYMVFFFNYCISMCSSERGLDVMDTLGRRKTNSN